MLQLVMLARYKAKQSKAKVLGGNAKAVGFKAKTKNFWP